MFEICLTNSEARKFILYKQGLLGDYRFSEKEGILDFIRQAGCIQFDPIDVCGTCFAVQSERIFKENAIQVVIRRQKTAGLLG